MDLVLVGLNHKTAPIEIREKVAFHEEALPLALKSLVREFGFDEAMIVSTCNRVELLASGTNNGAPVDGRLREFLCRYHTLDASVLKDHLYTYSNEELVHHVFRVASSLDSMILGEAQILGQLKQAYSCAEDSGAIGQRLGRLIPHAFFVAKRVRHETKVGHSAVSISSVAVELAVKIFGELAGRTVLLLGAGKMGELAARSLLASGASRIRVANRTFERAREVAAKFGGEVADFSRLEDEFVVSDIVIVSTGSKDFVVRKEHVDRAIHRRKYNPLFIVDIAVPRNVEPAVNAIETAFCYDIDDLQAVVDANLEERLVEAELAESIIREEVHNFSLGDQHRNVGAVVGSFRQTLEQICLEELSKVRDSFPETEYRKLEQMMLRTAHRIAHPFMVEIKKGEQPTTAEAAALIKRIFRLKDSE
ncbi:MAG: glutamyl-tRNA reductase [Acidobacteriota bacterium]|jgi:glutamyl-tRNA reductase